MPPSLSNQATAVSARPPPGVLFVGNFLSATGRGSRTVAEELAERFAAGGWPVVCTSERVNRLARLADMLFTIWRQRRRYQVAQVDVYSGGSFVWAEWCSRLLAATGTPTVLALHGGNLPAFAAAHPARVRRLFRRAARITAPSPYLPQALAAYLPEPRSTAAAAAARVTIIPNPLDVQAYPFRQRAQVRPRLAWLRAFHHLYRPTLAPEVLALLRRQHPDATLAMAGPDKGDGSEAATRRAAAHAGVAAAVTFAGRLPKTAIGAWLAQSDIFLNTTTVDNTPVTVLEAMATGLCVVSTNVGGMPWLVADGEDGLLVPPDDAGLMATAVTRLLDNPELGARLSQNGRAKAQTCDWGVVLPQWERIFRQLQRDIPRRPSPAP